jgi:N,N-dimethylformamidase
MRYSAISGYSDRISVRGGEVVRFMVSCDRAAAYRAQLVRIRCGDTNPEGPGYREIELESPINGTYQGRTQAIHAGSYVLVPPSRRLEEIRAFTLAAMIWPTTPGDREQTLIACWDAASAAGFELFLDDAGAPALRLGDGKGDDAVITSGVPVRPSEWCFVAAAFEPAAGTVLLHQRQQITYPGAATAVTGTHATRIVPAAAHAPLLIAARRVANADARTTEAHYNGKIDSPRLAGRALSAAELPLLLQDSPPGYLRPDIVAAWDFSREIPTERVIDVSGNSLHGRTVNLPARAMTGHNWTGAEMRWTAAPHQYGAIHFHDDDIYDAGWQADFALTVPQRLQSGCYAVRLQSGEDEEYIPFFVRPATGKPGAGVLYIAQTATYLAYANLSYVFTNAAAELLMNRLVVVQPWEERLNAHPELGASLYDVHRDGSGICYSSRLRPILNMRPKVQTASGGLGSMLWGYNADTHLTDWLEAAGHDFDVITDEDLDAEGVELLRHYRVVLTGTHPEYYSTGMLDALERYTAGGGRLMYMGGNGFYWRIAYHPDLPGVMEVRRAEDGTRAWLARPGEYYHSFTGKYGGLWRRQERAPQKLVGVGFIAQGFDLSSGYRRLPASEERRVAFAFEGIGRDEAIGNFGLIGGGAAGLEVDIVDPALGSPPHTLAVASSEELPDTFLLVNEEQLINTPDVMGSANPRIRSDLAFFETGNGGAVFSFSSIAWCGSLAHNGYDNNVARLTGNVLCRFLSPEPFAPPAQALTG